MLFSRLMAADPKFSAGARLERKAMREYLHRRIKRTADPYMLDEIQIIIRWVLKRQARYDRKAGGLGK